MKKHKAKLLFIVIIFLITGCRKMEINYGNESKITDPEFMDSLWHLLA